MRASRRTAPGPGELLDALLRPGFPLYGLPSSWTGDRYLAGWDGWPGAFTGLGLGHRNESAGTSLVVHIAVKRDGRDLPQLSDHLAESLYREVVGSPDVRTPRGAQVQRTKVIVNLDGASVPFQCLSEDDMWLMYGEHEGTDLILRGRRFPRDEVELVRLPDAGPYLQDLP